MKFSSVIIKRLAFPTVVVAAWLILSWSAIVSPILLPSPLAVVEAVFTLIAKQGLLEDFFVTGRRVSSAIAIGAMIGVPVGLLFGYKPRIYSWFEDTLNALRSVPATCLFPLLLIVIGVGESAIIVLAAYPCLLLFMVNAATGAQQANPYRLRYALAFTRNPLRIIVDVLFYEALPLIMAALRTCVSYALVLVVAVEMFIGVGKHGLGRKIFDLQSNFQIPETYAAIILTGAFGVILNYAVNRFEARMLHWLPNSPVTK